LSDSDPKIEILDSNLDLDLKLNKTNNKLAILYLALRDAPDTDLARYLANPKAGSPSQFSYQNLDNFCSIPVSKKNQPQ
jgi:hypothetical protein